MFNQLMGNIEVNAKIGIMLPTYCESENVEKLINEIERLPLDASILVIDDSSPDGTADMVKTLQKRYPNILLMVRPQKSGLGSAITDGFRTFLGLPHSPDFVVTMDADYSHNPKDIPRLVSSMDGGNDVVIGSRYVKGGQIEGWPLGRKMISRCANALARSVLGLKLHDCTSGFRCYSTGFLRQTISYLHSQTYDIQIETVKQAHNQRFKMAEVPVLFVNRKVGKSKLTSREIENYVSYIFKTVVWRPKN
jgi:dolichol-phosphate mannosyltransferase